MIPNLIRSIYARLTIRAWTTLFFGTGFVAGLGVFTFTYAQGLSYMSNDPKACVNCHVMRDVYDRWNHGSHKAVATCNDCHVPHTLIAKYATKAENGFHHSKAFTLGNFHEPIQIRESSRKLVEQNCLYCHGDVADPILQHGDADCLRCHSTVGH